MKKLFLMLLAAFMLSGITYADPVQGKADIQTMVLLHGDQALCASVIVPEAVVVMEFDSPQGVPVENRTFKAVTVLASAEPSCQIKSSQVYRASFDKATKSRVLKMQGFATIYG
jgi:hypothetical protein